MQVLVSIPRRETGEKKMKTRFLVAFLCLILPAILLHADNLQEANKLYEQGNFAFAYKLYTQTLQDKPDHPDKDLITYKMAVCQYKMGNLSQAEALANVFLRKFSISAYRINTVFLIADIDLAKGNQVSALRKYFKAIKKYPKAQESFEAKFKVAQIYIDLDRPEEAEKVYSDELKKNPKPDNLIRLYYGMGQMYESNDNFPQALASYKKCVMTVTTNIGITANAQYRIADILMKTGEYAEAYNRYVQIANNFPQFFDKNDLQYRKAYSLQMTGKLDESLNLYKELQVKDVSSMAQVSLRIIEIQLLKGDTNQALSQIEVLMTNDGINENIRQSVIERKARILFSRSQFDKALQLISSLSNRELALLISAQVYFQKNNFAEALKSLVAYEKDFPDSDNMDKVLFLTGKIYYSLSNFDEAIPRFKSIYEKYPSSQYWDSSLFYMGLCQKALSRYDDALVTFNRLADLTKDTALKADARHEIAMVYYAKQRYKEAADQYSLLAKEYPDRRGIFLFNTGESYLRMGYTNAAMEQFRSSLVDSTSQPVISDIYTRIRNLLVMQRKFNDLIKITRHALTNSIKSDLMVQTLITSSYEQGLWQDYLTDHFRFFDSVKDVNIRTKLSLLHAKYLYNNMLYQNAVDLYKSLIDDSRIAHLVGGEALYEIGMCYLNMNDIQNAETYFSKALDSKDLPESIKIDIHNQNALYYYKNRNYPKARFHFSNLDLNFPSDPNRIQTLYWIGMCYFNEKEMDRALSFFEKASKEQEDSPIMDQLLLRIGDVYFELANYAQAALTYKQILSRFPKSGALIPAKLKLAQCYERLNNPEEAQKIHQTVSGTNMGENPSLFPSYFQMALLLMKNNDFSNSLRILDILEQKQFQYADTLYYQASILRMTENYPAAIEKYIKIIFNKFEGYLAESLYYMGYCYEQTGDKSKALDYYNRTQTFYPGTSWASMALIKSRKLK